MEYITLNNGVKCPVIGIGTFMLTPVDAENSVREALKMGYSLVDTANAYVNERAVGRGMKESGVRREDIFLSTKLWPSEYENPNAVDETLERLGVDYVDLLYIHQPAGNWLAGYRQLEKAYREGKAKAIGISNFEGKYIEALEKEWEIVPQFIQVEAHPYYTQKELRVTLDKYGIKLMSWYPLGHGDKSLISELVFAEIGAKYGKTPAQVILRWHTQMGFAVIPGSRNVDHIRDNLNILDFTLTDAEMAEIAQLDKDMRYYHRTDAQLQQFAAWRGIVFADGLDTTVDAAHHSTASYIIRTGPIACLLAAVLFIHREERRLIRALHQVRQVLLIGINHPVQVLGPLNRVGVAIPTDGGDECFDFHLVVVGHESYHRLHVVGFDIAWCYVGEHNQSGFLLRGDGCYFRQWLC